MNNPSLQRNLFGDADELVQNDSLKPGGRAPGSIDAISGGAQRAGPKAPASPELRAFRRARADVERLKLELEHWRHLDARLKQFEAAQLQPAFRALQAERRELLRWMDAFVVKPPAAPRLTPKQRRTLVRMICLLAEAILAEEEPGREIENIEVVAIHDRHASITRAEQQAQELAMARELAPMLAGAKAELDLDSATSAAEVIERARSHVQDAQGRAAERREQRRQQRAASRPESSAAKAQAQDGDAAQTMREIYRRLASAVHPDRASDAADHARRTATMQRVNDAQARGDLLELLQMQVEHELSEALSIDGRATAPQRLVAMTRVLHAQRKTLQQEVDGIAVAWHVRSGLPQTRVDAYGRASVQAAMAERLADFQAGRDGLRADFESLRDSDRMRRVLSAMQLPPEGPTITDPMLRALLEAIGDDSLEAALQAAAQEREMRPRRGGGGRSAGSAGSARGKKPR